MFLNAIKSVSFFCLLIGVSLVYSAWVLVYRLLGLIYLSKKDVQLQIHKIACLWGGTMFRLIPGWKIRIVGTEHLPPEGTSVVVVANHESATDVFAIYFLNIQFRWLAKASLFRFPIFGPAMRAAGYIPVYRGNHRSHHEALEKSKETIRSGVSMLFFPEGTRSTDGKMKEFKVGAFKIAKECQKPVLPVVLKGAGKLLKKGTLAPCSAELVIHILPQVFCQEEESISDFTKRVENLMRFEHSSLD